jgi:hypothetical protein
MDYTRMTAPCGLDCFNCPLYLAIENEGLRATLAKRMNIPIEKVSCRGCRDEKGLIPYLNMTEPCNVYRCTQEKGIDFCCDCEDFPCDYLHPYADKANQVPHNTKVFNLCLIRKMGLEEWAKKKARTVKQTYFKEKWKL